MGIVPGLSNFCSQGCFMGSLGFPLYGADRKRHASLNHMGIKLLASQSFTFYHFRINVIIVPIYLPIVERQPVSGESFPADFPCLSLPREHSNFLLPCCPSCLFLPPLCRKVGGCFSCPPTLSTAVRNVIGKSPSYKSGDNITRKNLPPNS